MGVHREDALEHPDGAVDDEQDRQHGRDAEADARDPDERAKPVAAQVDNDKRKKAHGAKVRGAAHGASRLNCLS